MPPCCRCPILLYTPLRCFPQSVPDRPAGNKPHYRSHHRLPYWNGQVPSFRWQHRWCTPQCCAPRSRRFHLYRCLADMPFRRSLSYPASPALHPLRESIRIPLLCSAYQLFYLSHVPRPFFLISIRLMTIRRKSCRKCPDFLRKNKPTLSLDQYR